MKWISVEESRPDKEILAIDARGNMMVGYIYRNVGDTMWVCENEGVQLDPVTHWMLLPDPPEGSTTR